MNDSDFINEPSTQTPQPDAVSQKPSSGAAFLFAGGQVCCLDAEMTRCEAVAASCDGRVLACGSEDDLLPLCSAETERIDLAGRFLLPGLLRVEPSPIEELFAAVGCLRFDPAMTLEEVLSQVREEAAETPRGDLLFGWGFSAALLEEMPVDESAALLDGIADYCTIILLADDQKTLWCSRSALRQIEEGAAADEILLRSRRFDPQNLRDVFAESLDELFREGVTTIFSGSQPPLLCRLYARCLMNVSAERNIPPLRFFAAATLHGGTAADTAASSPYSNSLYSLGGGNAERADSGGGDGGAVIRERTILAARACGLDTCVGSIEPGKYADFVLYDEDPFTYTKRENAVLPETQALCIGGRKCYDAEEAADMDWYSLMLSQQF
ncbi:MAG: amidohydrolase family protein [Anaerovoracaceae bacterium]|jgi:predicted amidohydrolase YtcJ